MNSPFVHPRASRAHPLLICFELPKAASRQPEGLPLFILVKSMMDFVHHAILAGPSAQLEVRFAHTLVFVLSLAEGQANPKVQARRAGLLGRAVLRTAILSWPSGLWPDWPAVVA